MSFKIGDKVKCRSQKDLFCEFGEAREPYHPGLFFDPSLFNTEGIVCNKDNLVIDGDLKTIVCVDYDSKKWWYYLDVLERVKSDEI